MTERLVHQPEIATLGHTAAICRELIASSCLDEQHLSPSEAEARRLILEQAHELTGLAATNHRTPLEESPPLLEFQGRLECQLRDSFRVLRDAMLESEHTEAMAPALLVVGTLVLQAALSPQAVKRTSVMRAENLAQRIDDPRGTSLANLLRHAAPRESTP